MPIALGALETQLLAYCQMRGRAALRAELARDSAAANAIAAVAIRYSNISSLHRLGKLLKMEGVEARLLRKIERALPQTSAEILWCPTRAKLGTIDRRWGVVFNA